jgi:hypothetical protein
MSLEAISTIAGIVIVAFVLGQHYAHEQQIKRELAEACRKSDAPGRCGLGMKCDHHGPPEIACARQRQRMLEECIASRTGPLLSCPLPTCTHHPDYIWVREGVDYSWTRSWRRGNFWAQKDEWARELAAAEAIYSGRPAEAVIEPAVVRQSRTLAAPRKPSKADALPHPPVDELLPPIVDPPLADEERCAFQSVAMGMLGSFLTRCRLRLDHDGDHLVTGGGCLGGTRAIPAGTPTAVGTADGEFQPVPRPAREPIEPLPGDGTNARSAARRPLAG